MIHHSVVQGSEAWHRLRIGIPTASQFHRIITPKEWKLTAEATRRKYQIELLTEYILGMPLDDVTTAAMDHGKDWEGKARAAYEMMHGCDVEPCGFCTNDEGTAGASPDGFCGEDGSTEFKCPANPEIHVGYMVDPASFKQSHFVQTQGQLYITSRKWTDLVSYFMGMPMVEERVFPVIAFQEKLDSALKQFAKELEVMKATARANGWVRQSEQKAPKDYSREFISDADVEFILSQRRGD